MSSDQPAPAARRATSAMMATAGMMMLYPRAKRELTQAFSAEEVEAMAPAEVTLRWIDWDLRRVCDDQQKWTLLPADLRRPFVAKAEADLDAYVRNKSQFGPAMIVGLLLPAVRAASAAEERVSGYVALFQTAEAIRAHAAKHGEFPASLDKLDPLPALKNPRSGGSFTYERTETEGGPVAILSLDDAAADVQNKSYRLRLRK